MMNLEVFLGLNKFRGGRMHSVNPFVLTIMLTKVVTYCLALRSQDTEKLSLTSEKISYPIVVNTWPFREATREAWKTLYPHKTVSDGESNSKAGSVLDAIERGCSTCEALQCDKTVGFGGNPDEQGETTLDAHIMNGDTFEIGGVADLRHVKTAITTARYVLEKTDHSVLAGMHATAFAQMMGQKVESLTTVESLNMYKEWRQKHHCQPNFWKHVHPNPKKHCGPYKVKDTDMYGEEKEEESDIANENAGLKGLIHADEHNHDTISMIALDVNGHMACGSSTNGLNHKIPGRVGDAAIAGGGSYCDSTVGGCAATGDGDIHLRFLPCLLVVESMRSGMTPKQAAEHVMRRMVTSIGKDRAFSSGIVAMDTLGNIGAASYGWDTFKYTYQRSPDGENVVDVVPITFQS